MKGRSLANISNKKCRWLFNQVSHILLIFEIFQISLVIEIIKTQPLLSSSDLTYSTGKC